MRRYYNGGASLRLCVFLAASALQLLLLSPRVSARSCSPLTIMDAGGSLRQLHVMFRHGDRMPTSLYPKDPNSPADLPAGLGRITKTGKNDQYALGQYLRSQYDGFLTNNPLEVMARSSGRDRCLESIQTNLAALYPPIGKHRWNENVNWQPIPIHTMPVDIDGMLYEDAICQRAEDLLEENRKTGQGKEVLEKHAKLLKTLEEKSGKKMTDWVSVRDLLDTIMIEKAHGLVVPDWATPLLDEMKEVAKYTTLLNYKNPEYLKLRGGLFIKDMMNHFNETKQGKQKHKLYMYASHDVLVAAYQSAFGVFDGLAVPSSTAVITELHELTPDKFTVRMMVKNDPSKPPKKLKIAGCDYDCPLEKFEEIAKKFIPQDWRAECKEQPLPKGVKLYGEF